MLTKQNLIDSVTNIASKFQLTDDSRFSASTGYLSFLIDTVRAELIYKQYNATGVIDQVWLSDLGLLTFHEVNAPDDPNVQYCNCNISKTFIPPVVSLFGSEGGNADLGLYSIMSSCGKTGYYYLPMQTWKVIPKEHIRSKFNYYSRINTALYVNKLISSLRVIAILQNPADGFLINSTPVTTIVTGTVYIVKFGNIIYNSVPYVNNDTFTGVVGQTTFVGNGKVVLQSQQVALDASQPYPVDGAMARLITLEILTKEFKIEASELADVENDSVDEQIKDQPIQKA